MHEKMEIVECSFFDIAVFYIPLKNLNRRDTGLLPTQKCDLVALFEQHLREPLADKARTAGDQYFLSHKHWFEKSIPC
jgi:hypothetical protein